MSGLDYTALLGVLLHTYSVIFFIYIFCIAFRKEIITLLIRNMLYEGDLYYSNYMN